MKKLLGLLGVLFLRDVAKGNIVHAPGSKYWTKGDAGTRALAEKILLSRIGDV